MILQRYLRSKGKMFGVDEASPEMDLFRHICGKVFALIVS